MSKGDLAVDTNVFVHADSPQTSQFAASVEFLKRLSACSLRLTVDSGFSLSSQTNQSRVGHEYIKHIPPTALGFNVLIKLLTTDRVALVDLRTPSHVHKRVNSLVKGSRPCDRVFLKLAWKSARRELVSHDFEDFQAAKRADIKRVLGVSVCTASEWPGGEE
jgi:hypothetical protein